MTWCASFTRPSLQSQLEQSGTAPEFEDAPPVGGPLFDTVIVQRGASNVAVWSLRPIRHHSI